jgi:hypothetical protein
VSRGSSLRVGTVPFAQSRAFRAIAIANKGRRDIELGVSGEDARFRLAHEVEMVAARDLGLVFLREIVIGRLQRL